MQPLDGIRVLDLGTYLAGPFCATVLGEFGADVIKLERPGCGDRLRRFGTETECGDTLVWLSESRNKRSVTVDLARERGLELLRDLIAEVDVVIENFRPGVRRPRPAARPPAGSATSWRRTRGPSAPSVRERMGADTVNVLPHSHYEAADGTWVAIACTNDEMFARLARAMGQPELADGARWGDRLRRLAARDEVNAAVSGWVGSFDRDEILARCRAAEVPAGPLYSIAEIFEDPQYQHRGTIATADSRIGPLAVPGVLPALSATPGSIRWLGPELGAHTEEVLCEVLGRSQEDVDDLRAEGAI